MNRCCLVVWIFGQTLVSSLFEAANGICVYVPFFFSAIKVEGLGNLSMKALPDLFYLAICFLPQEIRDLQIDSSTICESQIG